MKRYFFIHAETSIPKCFAAKLLIMIILCLISVGLTAMGGSEVTEDNGKKNIAVTFDAMKELTEAVAGGKVNISVIIPPGMEPHDFEPKAKDLLFLSKADAVVYNGLGMEFWLERALNAVNNKKLIKIEASKGVDVIKSGHNHEECDCGLDHGDGHEHCHHGEFDPHIWLSLSSAKIMVKNIADGLCFADKKNADFYKANAEKYIAELDFILKEYTEKFAKIKNKHFVTGHAAFAYLCRDFNLKQEAVTGIFAEGEPNAKKLAELVEYCRENNVKVIFSEELANPEISRTLAKEINAKIEKIYTIESSEDGLSYLDRMKANIKKICENLSK